ncbi:hypothetical protein L3X38_010980 [Prunus dulcis]|uniref:Uncharacterized protein n=1 Tax=Prunus dulcis TaxID=3755 RepID=A0AAD4ZEQ0_PRUDU|nr:hypothetical protein L3X38_010980 [Prunus dulcis]
MPSFKFVQQFLEPFKPTGRKRGSKKAAASNTVDLPASKLKNLHHFVRDILQLCMTPILIIRNVQSWLRCCTLISDTLARVLFDMHFYDESEVEEVKQKGLTMSMYTPFSVCIIADVPQQRDG